MPSERQTFLSTVAPSSFGGGPVHKPPPPFLPFPTSPQLISELLSRCCWQPVAILAHSAQPGEETKNNPKNGFINMKQRQAFSKLSQAKQAKQEAWRKEERENEFSMYNRRFWKGQVRIQLL